MKDDQLHVLHKLGEANNRIVELEAQLKAMTTQRDQWRANFEAMVAGYNKLNEIARKGA